MPNMKGFEARAGGEGRRGRRVRRGERSVLAAEHQLLDRRESIERFAAGRRRRARRTACACAATISCVLGCPYEGEVDAGARSADVAAADARHGRYESRSATPSASARPARTQRAAGGGARASYPVAALAGHFHDTYGQALANIYAGLEIGVATFDCSVAGLGGCPYAKGATGNVATEDVVYLLHGLGIETGIDLDRLRAAGRFISDALGRADRRRASPARWPPRTRRSADDRRRPPRMPRRARDDVAVALHQRLRDEPAQRLLRRLLPHARRDRRVERARRRRPSARSSTRCPRAARWRRDPVEPVRKGPNPCGSDVSRDRPLPQRRFAAEAAPTRAPRSSTGLPDQRP